MQKSNTKLVFFGTSEFAVQALELLAKAGFDIVAVITNPDEPAGRKKILTPPSVKVATQKLNLTVWQPKNLKPENLNLIGNWKLEIGNCDLGIVAAYGKIIPSEIINLPKHGILNIHPSLLPKYRGPSPVQSALLNGEKTTGVTIIKIDEELDHGPVLAAEKYEIKNENYEELHNKLAKLGAELLLKTISGYLAGEIKPVPQEHNKATYTKKFVTENGEIKFSDSTLSAFNKIRALNPQPGTYIMTGNKRFKIIEAEMPESNEKIKQGFSLINNQLVVGLADGYLILKTVQPESKKIMSGKNFSLKHVIV